MLKLSFNQIYIDIIHIICQCSIRKSWSIQNFLIPVKKKNKKNLRKVLNTFENIMGNGAPKYMLYFKGVIME